MFSELNLHEYAERFFVGRLWNGYFKKLHAMLDELAARVDTLEHRANHCGEPAQPTPPNADGPTEERPWWFKGYSESLYRFTNKGYPARFAPNGQPLGEYPLHMLDGFVSQFKDGFTRLPDETPLPVLRYADMMRRTYVNGKDGEKWRWSTLDDPKVTANLLRRSDGCYQIYAIDKKEWSDMKIEWEQGWTVHHVTPEKSASIEARLRGFESVEAMLREDEKKCTFESNIPDCKKCKPQEAKGLGKPICPNSLTLEHYVQLQQLQQATWDGNILSKSSRDCLVKAGLAHHVFGWSFISPIGAEFLRNQHPHATQILGMSDKETIELHRCDRCAELQAKLATAERERDEAKAMDGYENAAYWRDKHTEMGQERDELKRELASMTEEYELISKHYTEATKQLAERDDAAETVRLIHKYTMNITRFCKKYPEYYYAAQTLGGLCCHGETLSEAVHAVAKAAGVEEKTPEPVITKEESRKILENVGDDEVAAGVLADHSPEPKADKVEWHCLFPGTDDEVHYGHSKGPVIEVRLMKNNGNPLWRVKIGNIRHEELEKLYADDTTGRQAVLAAEKALAELTAKSEQSEVEQLRKRCEELQNECDSHRKQRDQAEADTKSLEKKLMEGETA